MISMEGCYSIAENGSKHYGNLIVKTYYHPYNHSSLYNSKLWKNITFTPLNGFDDCERLCNNMMQCYNMYYGRENLFLKLVSVPKLLIFGIFVIYAVLLVAYIFKIV